MIESIYMAIDINIQKEALQQEAATLVDELKTLGVENPRTDKDWIPTPGEPADREADLNVAADRSEEWEERRGTLDVLETRLNNVKRALAKTEDGTYGVCEICDETIEADRLEANPAARTCKAHIDDEAKLDQ